MRSSACWPWTPRPAYQEDPERVYGLPFGGKDVHFRVEGRVLTVIDYA